MENSKFFDELHYITLSNKETLAYRKRIHHSSKDSLILLHGQASSSIIFEDLFPELEKNTEFDLYAVDMRGFGDSSYINEIQSISDLVEDIYLLIMALNLKNVSLAGVSTGGIVCQMFAINHPGILKSMFLICSVGIKGMPSYFEEEESNGNKITKRCKNLEELKNSKWRVAGEGMEKKDLSVWENLYQTLCFQIGKPMPKEKLKRFLEGTFKQRHFFNIIWLLNIYNISNEDNGVTCGSQQVSQIKTPTLILHGEQDLLIPLEEAEYTFKCLGEKISKIEVFPECGHGIFYSDAEKLVPLMKNFINGEINYYI